MSRGIRFQYEKGHLQENSGNLKSCQYKDWFLYKKGHLQENSGKSEILPLQRLVPVCTPENLKSCQLKCDYDPDGLPSYLIFVEYCGKCALFLSFMYISQILLNSNYIRFITYKRRYSKRDVLTNKHRYLSTYLCTYVTTYISTYLLINLLTYLITNIRNPLSLAAPVNGCTSP